MAAKKKRRKKRRNRQWLKNFFVKNGHLRRFNTFLVAVLIFALAMFVSDLNSQPAPPVKTASQLQYERRMTWLNSMAPYAQELQQKYGILASISLAQAAHESNWNNSELSSKYHNFYGVKAGPTQKSVKLPTSEFVNNQWVTVDAPFRVYDSWQQSMLDHTLLMMRGTTESPQRYYYVLHAKNYVAAANALVKAGYATDPAYATRVINIIKTYRLDRFDTAR